MKRVFFFIALALMLASCASTRKVQEATTTVSVESASVQETTKQETETVVDTTRCDLLRIYYFCTMNHITIDVFD